MSHRALILGGLARGSSRIGNLNPGADVGATARCMMQLGVRFSRDLKDQAVLDIEGSDLVEPDAVLDAGNSGTTVRLLMGVAAGGSGCCTFTGDESLRRRPMSRVTRPLEAMGARVMGRRGGDLLPLTVAGARLQGITHLSDVASAQVKSALLLAGLSAEGETVVTEPALSRDHTERMLEAVGVPITRRDTTVTLTGRVPPDPLSFEIPGDLSSAMYLVAAAVLIPGSDLTVTDVGLNPTRTRILDVLTRMGGDLEWEVVGERCGEPVGTVRARHGSLKSVEIGPDEVPRLIDEIPILAILATQAHGTTRIAGAAELRVKESDRIASIAAGIKALRGEVEELPDGLVIEGPVDLAGGIVDATGDHRIAMSFAIAGMTTRQKVRVKGWSTVDTSFPGFLDVLRDAQRRG